MEDAFVNCKKHYKRHQRIVSAWGKILSRDCLLWAASFNKCAFLLRGPLSQLGRCVYVLGSLRIQNPEPEGTQSQGEEVARD